MATTFIFEELDDKTRDYLTAVRDNEGAGSPGVFATTSDSLPGCGCIAGPIVIAATLLFTLTTWIDVIYNDPLGVACLQTAGLLLGGWLLTAKFRGRGGRNAGNWVYVDPLHLYEAYREQVTVTPIDEVADASYTHNYDSNGNYQNSVINIVLGGNGFAAVTINSENRAEQMVTYLNYLAWARGPDGGDRADLAPADLGGLARYVVRNGDEPKDAENNINLSLIELDIPEVPEEPAREGRATPAFLPYVFMFVFAVLCFLVMGFVINPVVRDDAIYDAVMKDNTSPPMTEPRFLRAYLTDPRNKLHRAQVVERLGRFYTPAMDHVVRHGTDKRLAQGMADVLGGLSKAEQPVVSLRITETKSPAGAGDRGARESKLRTEFADGLVGAFAAQPWGQPIQLPPGMTAKETLPPIGHQLIAFVEPPDDDKPVHFDVGYAFEPTGNDAYQLRATVTLRSSIEDKDGATSQFTLPSTYTAAQADQAVTELKNELIRRMVGAQGGVGQPGFGIQPGPAGINP